MLLLSDIHKQVVTVIKTYLRKMKPKTIRYRSYKNFNNHALRSTLLNKFMWGDTNGKLEDIVNSIISYINQRISLKCRYVRANQVPYLNKIISKAITNNYMKKMSDENKRNYMRQRNYCVKLFRKEKKNFFAHLDRKNITDNKTFWQTVKLFFLRQNS